MSQQDTNFENIFVRILLGGDKMEIKNHILLKQVGAKIAYYRTLRDMKQSELARRARISRSALSRIERGKYNDNVSVVVLSDIAEALQIDIALLVTFNETERRMWWDTLPPESNEDEESGENCPEESDD